LPARIYSLKKTAVKTAVKTAAIKKQRAKALA